MIKRSILAGITALCLAVPSGLVITALPAIVQAQRPNLEAIKEQAFAGVNLTPEQKSQLAQIQQETRTQIEGTLTPEQLSQFKSAIVSGQDFRTAATGINISQEQKTKIRIIMQSAMQKGQVVLTPAQQQQVRQICGQGCKTGNV